MVNARKLSQRKHRQRQGRFLVEGLQLIGMALEAGHKPLEAFYCREQFQGEAAPALLAHLAEGGAELLPVSPPVMRGLAERDAPQGLVVTFPLFETPLDALELSAEPSPSLVLILDRLQDPGNLGALIRTADAAGARGVVLLEPCADPFDPKTVRGTMGSLFGLPPVRVTEPAALFERLRRAGLAVVGADARQGEIPWQSDVLRGPVALLLGNEARGLSADLRPHIERRARLPIVGRAESLNVAVAGGILMYAWLQQQELS
ncbi:MAG: TrmH family RNA methyltransferase [Anaerolineae bacterium]